MFWDAKGPGKVMALSCLDSQYQAHSGAFDFGKVATNSTWKRDGGICVCLCVCVCSGEDAPIHLIVC